LGKNQAGEKGAKGDENGEVKARDRENMLQAQSPKLIAERAVYDIACDERAQKRGSAIARKLLI
jgi:hypothetical protein